MTDEGVGLSWSRAVGPAAGRALVGDPADPRPRPSFTLPWSGEAGKNESTMKPEAVDGMQDANQDAHHLLLERLWTEFVEGWTAEAAVRSNPAARRAVEAGANPQDVAQALRAAAYSAVFGTLHRIDSGRAPEAPPGAPGWRLIEVSGGLPTGNDLTGLDETFVRLDPSGRAGADLWR